MIRPFFKSALPLVKTLYLMNKVPYHLIACSDYPPKADGTASGFANIQESMKFKTGSNPHKNKTTPPL